MPSKAIVEHGRSCILVTCLGSLDMSVERAPVTIKNATIASTQIEKKGRKKKGRVG